MAMSPEQKRKQEEARRQAYENTYCVDATGQRNHNMTEAFDYPVSKKLGE